MSHFVSFWHPEAVLTKRMLLYEREEIPILDKDGKMMIVTNSIE